MNYYYIKIDKNNINKNKMRLNKTKRRIQCSHVGSVHRIKNRIKK